MNRELDRTIESMIEALRQHILPAVQGDFARGQVYGVIYMLEQFRLQLDWAVPPLLLQLKRQFKARTALAALCEGTDAPRWPHATDSVPVNADGSELKTLCEEGNDWLVQVFEWLERARPALAADRAAAIEEEAKACAREVNAMEAQLTPRPMFQQMATGQDLTDPGRSAPTGGKT